MGEMPFKIGSMLSTDPEVQQGGRVLVVEDDTDIADVLRRSLRNEGYEVRTSADGVEALDMAVGFVPDLVVLDLGLPGLDGIEVCRRLRQEGDVPILMLTARAETEDRVTGLDSGADDYLVKPFERKELLARIRALLRRRPPRGTASLEVGDLQLNPDTREVHRGEREIELTNREFELLEFLMRNERLVVSRERLLDEVWGYDPMAATNTIDVFISNPRGQRGARGRPAGSRACCTRNAARGTSSKTDGRRRTQQHRGLGAATRASPLLAGPLALGLGLLRLDAGDPADLRRHDRAD